MIEYTNQLQDFDWSVRMKTSRPRKGMKRAVKKKYYIDDIITFDIETTSAWMLPDGSIIPYHTGEKDEYWNSLKPLAIPYIWQCSINDTVYYGKEFRSFLKLLHDIPNNHNCIIWVHNLGFEFEFLQNILTFNNVFARTPHKPMKASCSEYPKIEFRCSYFLTNMSLATWGDKLGLPKMVGDLDYEKLRTPLSVDYMTDAEMKYCERDCEVVYAGIKDYLTRYKDQWDIPMTSTGTIRRVVKDMLVSDPEYVKWLKKLVPKNPEEYALALEVFAGGYTHANRLHSNETITEAVSHRDYKSSYPYIMCSEKFPCNPWVHKGTLDIPDDSMFEDTAYIMKLRFKNIRSKNFNTYLQNSKCTSVNPMIDNGRIIKADELYTVVTEQDWLIIKNNYDWDEVKAEDIIYSAKDYLPKEYIEYILDLFYNKECLKGIDADQYNLSKTFINALYGMMVSAIMYADTKMDPVTHEWYITPLKRSDVAKKLDELRRWSKYEKRYFLSFWWGIYVCSYGRKNLWSCIDSLGECSYDCLYVDTDSMFYIGDHDFDWYNNICDEKLDKMCEHYGIDKSRVRPTRPDGSVAHLGYFEDEHDNIIEFRTLGAKRYVFRSANDSKLHLTVAGINKGAVECLHNDIDEFKDGVSFDKDHPAVTKRMHTYINNQGSVVWPDGYVSDFDYGINIRRTGYTLEIKDDYARLMHVLDFDIDIMDDTLINDIRRRWING